MSNDANIDDNLKAKLSEIRLNLENAIKLHRNDIVVSLINEWNKIVNEDNLLESVKFFYNSCYCENDTKTPLHLAYELNDRDIMRTLLNFGADPSILDEINKKSIIELISNEADQNMKQIISDAFLQSIIQNNVKQIRKFLSAGFDLNSTEYLLESNSFLHWAVLYSNESTIRFLIQNGANLNAQNKNGVTPLHDFVVKRKSELNILTVLLMQKPDLTIKASDGPYKDKTVLDLCDPELKNFINDQDSNINEPLTPNTTPKTPSTPTTPDYSFEPLTSWFPMSNLIDKNTTNDEELLKLLWPRPQCVQLHTHDTTNNNRFQLNEPFYIYIKSNNSSHIEFFNRLITVFTDMNFVFMQKEPNVPHISIRIDENLFHIENSYIINVKQEKIDIYVSDLVGMQYAFCTFLQLCNIYSNVNIPALKIYDYPNVKYRGVLIDFSQGFYFKADYLLSLLQMIAFFKLNQVHFYAKFSALQPNRKQWYHCVENWFNIIRFCDEFNLTIVPTVDIYNDVNDIYDVLPAVKEYLDLFKCCKFINVGPHLSTLLICIENKNPFLLDSTQYLMLCSYLYQNNDQDVMDEIEKFDKCIFMEYGFKVGHDFNQKCQKLHESGKPFFFCVGSSNWNSLFGCPDGGLLNLFDSLNNINSNKPNGLLLCEFVGALTKTPFAFNLNSIVMFAGPAWNNNIEIKEVKQILPSVINIHGLISDKDGMFGILMLELGHLETYLTRRAIHLTNYSGLPLDTGSMFTRLIMNPDDIELDFLDISILKKIFVQFRTIQIKMKALFNDKIHQQFKEVLITVELAINLLRFLITLYNAGTKQQTNSAGLSVINIGVNNISKTFRTDFANKILALNEELHNTWIQFYYEDCIDMKARIYNNLVDKLLKNTGSVAKFNGDYGLNPNMSFNNSIYFNNND